MNNKVRSKSAPNVPFVAISKPILIPYKDHNIKKKKYKNDLSINDKSNLLINKLNDSEIKEINDLDKKRKDLIKIIKNDCEKVKILENKITNNFKKFQIIDNKINYIIKNGKDTIFELEE